MEKKKPVKKQATLFQFSGFVNNAVSKSSSSEVKPCHCQYCGASHSHDGARKMHEAWCKEKPKEMFKAAKIEVSYIVQASDVVPFVVNDLLKEVVCRSINSGGFFFKTSVKPISKPKKSNAIENSSKEDEGPPSKKPRKFYSFLKQAEVLDKFQLEQSKDSNLSLRDFANIEGISKSIISR